MVELSHVIEVVAEQLNGMGLGCVVKKGPEKGLYLDVDESAVRTAALLLIAHLVEKAPEQPVHFAVETAIVDGARGMDSGRYAILEIRGGASSEAVAEAERFLDDASASRHLALHSAYRILNGIGGTVSAEGGESEVYRVYLPTVSIHTETKPQATILLLEDEDYVRNITREVLECEWYRVLEAGSPAQAIEVLKKNEFQVDLLLSDVVLPGMNGLQFASCLSEIAPNLKALFMSGYGELTKLREETTGWRTAYLQKPFTVESLACKVREVLEGNCPWVAPISDFRNTLDGAMQ